MLKGLIVSLFIVALMAGAAAYFFYFRITNPVEVDSGKAVVTINNSELEVELAKTNEEWTNGLSNRSSLEENHGMLFISDQLVLPGFWMKDMQFALDIIWIRNGKVIGVAENVPAPKDEEETLETYHPPKAVNMVLEVNAGWSAENEISEGNVVKVVEITE